MEQKLLSSNTKIDKSMREYEEYEASILQMLPSKHLCVNYKSCIKTCLAFQGYAKVYPTVIKGRKKRTDFYLKDRSKFLEQLVYEIRLQEKRAIKKNKRAVVRLNGFTDIDWDKPENYIDGQSVFEIFPDVIFYDYTADAEKVRQNRHANLHLTFSYKGNNDKEMVEIIKRGVNVAVIDYPSNKDKWFNKLPVIDGDKHDFRFLDAEASIVLLKEKK